MTDRITQIGPKLFRSLFAGPPNSGSWAAFDVVIDLYGKTHVCTLGGKGDIVTWADAPYVPVVDPIFITDTSPMTSEGVPPVVFTLTGNNIANALKITASAVGIGETDALQVSIIDNDHVEVINAIEALRAMGAGGSYNFVFQAYYTATEYSAGHIVEVTPVTPPLTHNISPTQSSGAAPEFSVSNADAFAAIDRIVAVVDQGPIIGITPTNNLTFSVDPVLNVIVLHNVTSSIEGTLPGNLGLQRPYTFKIRVYEGAGPDYTETDNSADVTTIPWAITSFTPDPLTIHAGTTPAFVLSGYGFNTFLNFGPRAVIEMMDGTLVSAQVPYTVDSDTQITLPSGSTSAIPALESVQGAGVNCRVRMSLDGQSNPTMAAESQSFVLQP